jgi:hypothetical protein
MGQSVVDKISTIIGTLWSIVEPYLTQYYTDFVAWFTAQDWQQLGIDSILKVLDGLMTYYETLLPLLGTFFDTIKTTLEGLDWASIGAAIMTALIYSIGAVATIAQMAGDNLLVLFEAVWNWAVAQDWAGIGRLIIENILMGLAEAGGALLGGIGELLGGAAGAAQDLLGNGALGSGAAGGFLGNGSESSGEGASGGWGNGASDTFAEASDTSGFAPAIQNATAGASSVDNSVSVGQVVVQPPAGATRPQDYGQATQDTLRRTLRARGK